jgi:hypothetical protein
LSLFSFRFPPFFFFSFLPLRAPAFRVCIVLMVIGKAIMGGLGLATKELPPFGSSRKGGEGRWRCGMETPTKRPSRRKEPNYLHKLAGPYGDLSSFSVSH